MGTVFHLDGHEVDATLIGSVSLNSDQAEVIYAIHRELGFEVGEPFTPFDIFPNAQMHDPIAFRLRNTIRKLGEMGLLDRGGRDEYALNVEALAAYDAWA